MSKPNVTDVTQELEKYGQYRPQLKYYKENPKYNSLLPKDVKSTVNLIKLQAIYKEDEDLREAVSEFNKGKL